MAIRGGCECGRYLEHTSLEKIAIDGDATMFSMLNVTLGLARSLVQYGVKSESWGSKRDRMRRRPPPEGAWRLWTTVKNNQGCHVRMPQESQVVVYLSTSARRNSRLSSMGSGARSNFPDASRAVIPSAKTKHRVNLNAQQLTKLAHVTQRHHIGDPVSHFAQSLAQYALNGIPATLRDEVECCSVDAKGFSMSMTVSLGEWCEETNRNPAPGRWASPYLVMTRQLRPMSHLECGSSILRSRVRRQTYRRVL